MSSAHMSPMLNYTIYPYSFGPHRENHGYVLIISEYCFLIKEANSKELNNDKAAEMQKQKLKKF